MRKDKEKRPLHLFEGFGVELEYMIVGQEDLQVRPISDLLIRDKTGIIQSDVEIGELAWSNELVLHVIELKTTFPSPSLSKLPGLFQQQVRDINRLLLPHQARLLPTGAHPFMDPFTETKLWPHAFSEVYATYDRIFDCRGHGWANLQSTHLNLPFGNDEEFGRLHAAIRLLLPILPALSASTPLLDRQLTGFNDSRLEVYRKNQAKIPSLAGHVIPERVFSKQAYEEVIYRQIASDMLSHDPEKVLDEVFLNSRGAIARFDRQAIEIRVLDVQECPVADIAVLHALVETLKMLLKETWCSLPEQMAWPEEALADIFLAVIREGQHTQIKSQEYLYAFGYTHKKACTALDLWQHLLVEVLPGSRPPQGVTKALDIIMNQGNLSQRIVKALHGNPPQDQVQKVYRHLSECLQQGRMFIPNHYA
jgi:glutamate---cysteine ligase / carboxylate-amine ligase